MKLSLKILIVLFGLILAFTAQATLPVFDYTSFIELTQELTQLVEETKYIKAGLEGLNGSQYQWSDAQGLINNLGAIVQQTNGIAYSASDINGKFQKAYPGYQAPENYGQQYQNNVNTTINTLNGILQAMGSSAQDFQSENTRLAFLQAQVGSAQGQTQAIQASAQIASEMVSQIQLLRQTVVAQSNAQAVYYATQTQNEASRRAEQDKVVESGSTNVPQYGTSGNPLNPPSE